MKAAIDMMVLLVSVFGVASCGDDQTPTGPQDATGNGDHGDRITVYWGLNESHSRDWVQLSADGVVGITYFEKSGSSNDAGTLRYKTIHPDGSEVVETVATGSRLEASVLLYDESSNPHILVARSRTSGPTIDHYRRNSNDSWSGETIVQFGGEGGAAIYELSAATGPTGSLHLLALKTRYEVDSEHFMDAWEDSHLYHITNSTGDWERELVRNYDMAYTYDMYIKSSIRQDIQVDSDGFVHVVFSEQVFPPNSDNDPSRLWYATNETGAWDFDVALSFDENTGDEAGWFPSLALNTDGVPFIACVYIDRVSTGSATYAHLLLLERLGPGNWDSQVIADRDDGYHGGDGRDYTGGLAHLVFDSQNTPHVIFSDIASTHWPGTQRLSLGNIRYGVARNGNWEFRTIHRNTSPADYFAGTETHGLSLVISETTNTIHVVGQELVLTSERNYTSNLLDYSWSR